MNKKLKATSIAVLTATMVLASLPVSSMAAGYNPKYGSGDFWRIGRPSNYSRYVDVGDANEDGYINISDYIEICNTVNYGWSKGPKTTWERFRYSIGLWRTPDHMDINGDGRVTHQDADILLACLLQSGGY
ncbi:MAG: hypothetical protein J5685_10155 [Clostridiales bacterium]|nr:hypothetical protein [Clostridiales bacterium]